MVRLHSTNPVALPVHLLVELVDELEQVVVLVLGLQHHRDEVVEGGKTRRGAVIRTRPLKQDG